MEWSLRGIWRVDMEKFGVDFWDIRVNFCVIVGLGVIVGGICHSWCCFFLVSRQSFVYSRLFQMVVS